MNVKYSDAMWHAKKKKKKREEEFTDYFYNNIYNIYYYYFYKYSTCQQIRKYVLKINSKPSSRKYCLFLESHLYFRS